jgi:hypothetical protein
MIVKELLQSLDPRTETDSSEPRFHTILIFDALTRRLQSALAFN